MVAQASPGPLMMMLLTTNPSSQKCWVNCLTDTQLWVTMLALPQKLCSHSPMAHRSWKNPGTLSPVSSANTGFVLRLHVEDQSQNGESSKIHFCATWTTTQESSMHAPGLTTFASMRRLDFFVSTLQCCKQRGWPPTGLHCMVRMKIVNEVKVKTLRRPAHNVRWNKAEK